MLLTTAEFNEKVRPYATKYIRNKCPVCRSERSLVSGQQESPSGLELFISCNTCDAIGSVLWRAARGRLGYSDFLASQSTYGSSQHYFGKAFRQLVTLREDQHRLKVLKAIKCPFCKENRLIWDVTACCGKYSCEVTCKKCGASGDSAMYPDRHYAAHFDAFGEMKTMGQRVAESLAEREEKKSVRW